MSTVPCSCVSLDCGLLKAGLSPADACVSGRHFAVASYLLVFHHEDISELQRWRSRAAFTMRGGRGFLPEEQSEDLQS